LAALGDRHPRDLSGGERQRLALAIVMGGDTPAAVCLDEPTRGMDRAAKGDLADRLRALAASGVAVLVATHDAEFAAAFAQRVVLLADGRPIADGPIADVLTGGWYFATETARVVGALTPEEGAERIRRPITLNVTPAGGSARRAPCFSARSPQGPSGPSARLRPRRCSLSSRRSPPSR